MQKFLKTPFIILLNTFVLIIIIEVIVRIFWDQSEKAIIVKGAENVLKFDSGHYTFSHVPGVKYYHKNFEFKVYYEINKEGLRENETFLDKERDTSVIRVLVIGDSFTYGEGSELENVWHSRLERSLNLKGKRVEIINAGVGAYDQYQEYYCLKRMIDLYKPDFVLLGLVPNDILSNKPLSDKSWPNNLLPTDSSAGFYARLMKNYQTLALATRAVLINKNAIQRKAADLPYFNYFKTEENRSAEINKQYRITGVLLQQIDSLCESRKAGFIVVCIPHVYEAVANNMARVNLFTVENFIAGEAEKSGFVWLPSLDYFRKQNDAGIQTHYYGDGHLTPAGNKVLADAIKGRFEEILVKR